MRWQALKDSFMYLPSSQLLTSHISAHVCSFDADPFTLIKQFKFVFQSYNITYKDIHMILTSTLSPAQKMKLCQAAQATTNQ